MGRRSRAELQEQNRGQGAGRRREEFTERGFREAKVDHIADRAELTRGAVYSNFPSKRALYFAVLAEDAERAPGPMRPDGVAHYGKRALPARRRSASVIRTPVPRGRPCASECCC
jgi:AcrR family transcriptional regulator